MVISACEEMTTLLRKSCMLGLLSRWRESSLGSVTNKPKLIKTKAAVLIRFGKMETPVLRNLSRNITQIAKYTNVAGMLAVPTLTI